MARDTIDTFYTYTLYKGNLYHERALDRIEDDYEAGKITAHERLLAHGALRAEIREYELELKRERRECIIW